MKPENATILLFFINIHLNLRKYYWLLVIQCLQTLNRNRGVNMAFTTDVMHQKAVKYKEETGYYSTTHGLFQKTF